MSERDQRHPHRRRSLRHVGYARRVYDGRESFVSTACSGGNGLW
jgi:hypothetical protein